jgi:hypothetical protein
MFKEKFPYRFNINKDVKYLGVTSFLDSFEEPFDAIKIATIVSSIPTSEYYGIDVDTIINHWKDTGIRGNKKHKEIEDWLNFKSEMTEDCVSLNENLNVTQDNSYSEIKIYSNEYQLVGIVDLIQMINDTIIVHDIKTFSKVSDDKIDKASKQILLYCKMLRENIEDKKIKIKPGKIILIRPKSKISDSGQNFDFYKPEYVNINTNVVDTVKKMINVRKDDIKK